MLYSRSHSTTHGFTLIEVMVALLIMGVMAAMAWQGIDSMVRARDSANAHLENTLRLQSVMAQWDTDLRAITDTKAVPAFNFDGGSVRLTRHHGSGMQVVVWSLHGQEWMRWAGPVVTTVEALQQQWMASLQFFGTEQGQLHALSGVNTWQLFCYWGNSWANCQSTPNVAATQTTSAATATNNTSAASTAATGTNATTPVVASQSVYALPAAVHLSIDFAANVAWSGRLIRDVAL